MSKVARVRCNPGIPRELTPEERSALDALSDTEIEEAAKSDQDNPPLRDRQLDHVSRARAIQRIRLDTGLSQEAFANRFGFSLGAVRDWEQGRRMPDRAALAYLQVIQHEPDAVVRALERT